MSASCAWQLLAARDQAWVTEMHSCVWGSPAAATRSEVQPSPFDSSLPALQVPEAEFLRALRAAAEAAAQLLEPQRQLAAQTG